MLQAAVLAMCKPGDTLLLARNCHAAAFSAMVLAGTLQCKPYNQMVPGADVEYSCCDKYAYVS